MKELKLFLIDSTCNISPKNRSDFTEFVVIVDLLNIINDKTQYINIFSNLGYISVCVSSVVLFVVMLVMIQSSLRCFRHCCGYSVFVVVI